MNKLTTVHRAALFFLEQYAESILSPKTSLFGFVAGLLRKLIRDRRIRFHQWSDDNFGANRAVAVNRDDSQQFYVGLIALAQKTEPHN